MVGGIRELIRKHSTATVVVVLIVAITALGFSLHNSALAPETASTNAFYTVDEGQTTFVEDMKKIPPFDHDGKTAVRVWMFTTDGGKTKFPGYLERYKPAAKARIEAALAANTKGAAGEPDVGPSDIEVKKPGAGNEWVSRGNMTEAGKVMTVPCPDGKDLEVVTP